MRIFANSNALCVFEDYTLIRYHEATDCSLQKTSENLNMTHGIEKILVIGNRRFCINQLKTICSDGGMIGYCPSKIEILIEFGENCGILDNLKKI